MISRELMKNKDRIERIEIVREIRRKIGGISENFIGKEEKAMGLKALNDYESALVSEIERSKNVSMELKSDGIESNIDIVDVPKDLNRPSYPELENAGIHESLDANIIRLDDLAWQIPSIDFTDDEKRVFLEAIRDYLRSLKNLKLERENNQKAYGNEYLTNNMSETNLEKTYEPSLSQKQMFEEIYNQVAIKEPDKGQK